jgi:hypothetical protein
MSLLKWLGVWGMVGDFSEVDKDDLNKWSKSIQRVFEDSKGRNYFEEYAKEELKITLPPGECTHFPHFTIRPITCSLKWLYINVDVHQYSFVLIVYVYNHHQEKHYRPGWALVSFYKCNTAQNCEFLSGP